MWRRPGVRDKILLGEVYTEELREIFFQVKECLGGHLEKVGVEYLELVEYQQQSHHDQQYTAENLDRVQIMVECLEAASCRIEGKSREHEGHTQARLIQQQQACSLQSSRGLRRRAED